MPPRKDMSDRFARGNAPSKRRRPLTRPNVPLSTGPVAPPEGGDVAEAPARPAATATSGRPASTWGRRPPAANIARGPRVTPLTTDFEAVRRDLRRISVLAGGILVVMVALSFVIR